MKFTIDVEMEDRWTPHFLAMLKRMESLGHIGSSKHICFMADGDGDFRPKFKWDESLPSNGKPITEEHDIIVYDAG